MDGLIEMIRKDENLMKRYVDLYDQYKDPKIALAVLYQELGGFNKPDTGMSVDSLTGDTINKRDPLIYDNN